MPPASVPDSRFYLWRSVFAMAHADGKISDSERAFISNYLGQVPFSDGQREVIARDLDVPQNINAMLAGVTRPEDMADFFQFAQMLVWSDGDYDAQERAIIERLTAEQMNRFNKAEIAEQIRQTRVAASLRRAVEDREFARVAERSSIASYMKRLKHVITGYVSAQGESRKSLAMVMRDLHSPLGVPPDKAQFALWRATFALVNADGRMTEEERDYIEGMMQVFSFTEEQKQLVHADIGNPGAVGELFDGILTKEYQRQFFDLARTVLWCDGELHDSERRVITELSRRPGVDKDVVAWLEKKPNLPPATGETKEAAAMKRLCRQFADFYKKI